MSQKKVIGIDLGTTYCCVAYINEYGIPEVIPNAEGGRTTPSVVWFDDKRVVVGQDAKEMANVHPDYVCSFIKRNMGNDNFTFDVDGVAYTPEHVSSLILRKLVKDASVFLGYEVNDVVITCPAYFFVKEREATKRAGEIAGLNVLRIVNEPTAAAYSYGVKPNETMTNDKFVLVYDLGGGTFDVSIVRISKDGVDVVCTDGDHQLGGKDWDDALMQYLAHKFTEETQRKVDPSSDAEFFYDLQQKSESVKKQLTDRKSVKTKLVYSGHSVQVEIQREQFEQMTEDLLGRTIMLIYSLLKVARTKGCTKIDQLILVGGSSRMPQVAEKLRKELSIEPQLFEPDEAVAKGAALIGNNLFLKNLLNEKLQPHKTGLTVDNVPADVLTNVSKQVAAESGYSLETISNATKRAKNVSSKTFGITVLDDYDKEGKPVLSVSNLIYRNTPLPAERTEQYATIADKQKIVLIELVENTCDAPPKGQPEPSINIDDTNALWSGDLPVQPDLPIYSPINVTFKIDDDGRLSITALDPASGGKLVKSIPERNTELEINFQKVTNISRALSVE
ncbi:MAG: Hsp70 family protein [Planctomycetaceae bacterium]|jgi:molecular chaperone DnaK (HSP70)|nr:Hsp70 family protein [Planctomycetaceae bacterium]